MYDVITFGSITADLYFKADDLTTKDKRYYLAKGGKYFLNDFKLNVGGGGTNVAIGIKKNRLNAGVCGLVGNNEFRKAILHKLTLKGITKKFLVFKQKHDNISVILLENDGTRTTLKSENKQESLHLNKKITSLLFRSRAVYFGNLPDVSIDERVKLMKQIKNRKILLIINLGTVDTKRKQKELLPILNLADVLILNKYEFGEIVRKDLKKINLKKISIENYAYLKNKILVITDAENGSYAYFKNEVYFQKAISPKKIVDTTGAGDGYTAGFIAEYLKSEDIKLAMKKGAYYAAKILGRIGAN